MTFKETDIIEKYTRFYNIYKKSFYLDIAKVRDFLKNSYRVLMLLDDFDKKNNRIQEFGYIVENYHNLINLLTKKIENEIVKVEKRLVDLEVIYCKSDNQESFINASYFTQKIIYLNDIYDNELTSKIDDVKKDVKNYASNLIGLNKEFDLEHLNLTKIEQIWSDTENAIHSISKAETQNYLNQTSDAIAYLSYLLILNDSRLECFNLDKEFASESSRLVELSTYFTKTETIVYDECFRCGLRIEKIKNELQLFHFNINNIRLLFKNRMEEILNTKQSQSKELTGSV